jgi:hypothetical protein
MGTGRPSHLTTAVSVLGTLAKLLDRLEEAGVTITQINQLAQDKGDYWDNVVRAIKSPDSAYADLLLQYGEVGKTVESSRLRELLRQAFHAPERVEQYSDRDAFVRLLDHLSREPWLRAAVVMMYGLGVTGKKYSLRETAQLLDRHEATIGEGVRKLAGPFVSAHNRLSRADDEPAYPLGHFLKPLGLPATVETGLVRAGFEKPEQVAAKTVEELKEACASRFPLGPKRIKEIQEGLDRVGLSFKQ